MWLATRYGFYSIVQKQPAADSDPAVYHIRARVKKDLESLLAATGLKHEILEWSKADYPKNVNGGPKGMGSCSTATLCEQGYCHPNGLSRSDGNPLRDSAMRVLTTSHSRF